MSLPPRTQMRLLGLLPLLFFLAQAIHYWRIDQLGHIFWMCNIGNLVLALGLFLEKPLLVRVAAIWTIPGLFIWFVYVVLAWGVFLTSTLAHIGGLAVAAIALKTYRMDRNSWLYAFGWALLMQFISRLFTARDLNVNLAHFVQPGWDRTFTSYWSFWLVLTIATLAALWLSGLLWRTLWPAAEARRHAAASLS
ncbi:MAG TPA: hypothetical protein VJP89_11210 [Pyrinomonadaceae bacterium]|nr:hypothetical protein [Pyrinomonadaceae bacterium]